MAIIAHKVQYIQFLAQRVQQLKESQGKIVF